ncbi:MAG TPA: TIGR02270 family protein, partial [Isosphaeraceae bacterium]|nr:TIGR02270 family protein [Isosphaeraceae bacterium]
MLFIPRIAEQHAAEAAFLWLLRDRTAVAPHATLADLAGMDDRLESHVDGLWVAGQPGWEITKGQLAELGGPGEVFAAAVLAFESGDPAKIQDVMAAGTAKPESVRGMISALGWLKYDQASKHISALLAADGPALRRVGIAASAIHRRSPGPALQDAFAADDPGLKARAFRAAGELGLVDTHIILRANLKAKHPTVRFWAAWSNALLNGHKDAMSHLQNVAEAGGPFAERAAQMAIRRLVPNDARIWLKRLVKELGLKRLALIAAGAFADPEAIPFLIEQMKVPKLARVAGESFSMITGVRLDYDKLQGQKPEGFEAGPTDNPEDEKVEMDPDENLPWPDPALVQKW